jgi:hypothetical protein
MRVKENEGIEGNEKASRLQPSLPKDH